MRPVFIIMHPTKPSIAHSYTNLVLFTSLCITARVINPRTAVISVKIRNAALFVYQVRAWTSLKGRQPMRARGGMGAWLQASFDWLLLKRGEHTCYM